MMMIASKHRLTRVAMQGLLAAALLLSGAGFSAYADDDDDVAPDTKFIQGLLKKFGLRRDEANIDYRERSPLVVPPSRELPSPEAANAQPRTAAWPNDPDQRKPDKKKTIRAASNPDPIDASRPTLPNQYSSPAAAKPANKPDGTDRPDATKPMTPAELQAKSMFSGIWQKKEEYTTFSGEPPRTDLTQPPSGYLTPSPAQPYGVGKQRWDYGKQDRQDPVR